MGEIILRIKDALIAVAIVVISAEMNHAQNVLVHNLAILVKLAVVVSASAVMVIVKVREHA